MKTIIIEDIIHEVELIKSLLKLHFPEVEVIGIADSVENGIQLISSQKPDFLLMDIEIMGGTSYDILASLQNNNIPIDFEIIFLTGNRKFDYATMAFAYSALDFITKPIDTNLFQKAVSKAIQNANPQQYESQLTLFMDLIRCTENQSQSRLAITKIGGVIEFINIENIVFLEADREVTCFNLKGNQIIKASKNLGFYDHLLVNHHHFFSISNSYLINLEELRSYDHSQKLVVMSNGQQVYASRRGGQDLKNYISNNPNLRKKSSFYERIKGLLLPG
jgi:two-component system LytT family response regulator